DPAPRALAGDIAAGIKPSPSRDTPAAGFRLRSAWLRWLLEKLPSVLSSTFRLRARCWSILSMTSPSGSSCVGIPSPLQAHLVLDKTCVGADVRSLVKW